MHDTDQSKTILTLTAQIVSAHVKNNQVSTSQLQTLIRQVHAALAQPNGPPAPARVEPEKSAAIPVPKKTVFPDYIICLEDGRKMKTLKRHLRSNYDMSPEQYREKWDLASDYPMVAPNYAARRSTLAKQIGLGRRAPEAEKPQADIAENDEKQEPLPQMPARMWQIVSAPEPAAAAPEPERRPEPTLDSVFGRFPKTEEAAHEAAEPDAQGQRRSARKPFSKQLSRTMRP